MVNNSGGTAEDAAREALERLVALNHPTLREVLAESVNHPLRRIRLLASLWLAELFLDERALPGLADALGDRDHHTQSAAARALWDIGDVNTTGLIQALSHTDSAQREAITIALERIGWQPEDVADQVTYLIVSRRWRECFELGEAAVAGLIRALHDPDGNVRRGAAWALGEIEDERAVPYLVELLADTQGGLLGVGERVCDIAAEGLEKIGTDEALEAVKLFRA